MHTLILCLLFMHLAWSNFLGDNSQMITSVRRRFQQIMLLRAGGAGKMHRRTRDWLPTRFTIWATLRPSDVKGPNHEDFCR